MSSRVIIVRVVWIGLLITLFAGSGLAAEGGRGNSKKCKSGLEVALTFESGKLTAFRPAEVSVELHDARGKPVTDALIYCSFFMANFATGSNRPKLKASGQDGIYTGIVFFNREGDWLGNLTINLPDGTFEEVTFEIDNVMPASG